MPQISVTGKSPKRVLSVSYLDTGDIATIPETHEAFQQIIDLTLSGAGDDEIRDLVNIVLGAKKRLTTLSERVSIQSNELFFDGDPISGALVETIIELFGKNSSKLGSVVNFLEKVKTNPDISSIDGLWKWIERGDLVLTEDGDFLAYKGMSGTGAARTSRSSGKAFVNGEEVEGQIPNPDGAVISMPRSKVDDGGYQACSTGLHAATHDFARGFAQGGDVVLIKVNPRDVVSVPKDESFQKLRVCRYTVLHAVSGRLDGRLYVQPELAPERGADEVIDKETWDEAHEAASALWSGTTLGDEEDVAGEIERDDESEVLQDKLNEALGIDDSFYEDDDDEESPKLEALAEREPVWTDEPAEDDVPVENPFEEDEKPEKADVHESIRKDLAAATESVQKTLRDANGRFTKEGARHEAIAGKRDALGRFIKNS